MKVRNQKKNKCLIALVLVFVAIIAAMLGACSKNDSGKDSQVASNTPVVEESAEISEEVQQPEAEASEEPTEEVQAEPTETTPEELKVEMVDFETWAKQEGNDEVCLVVWNEELGVQEIVPPVSVSRAAYEIQEGDRFAIPYRENIESVGMRDQPVWIFDANLGYFEMTISKGEVSIVDIIYTDEAGKRISLSYSFK